MKKILLFSILVLLISACLPQDVQVPQSPLLPVLERKSGLIAYIGLDGNIYVTDQSGRTPSALTADAAIPQDQSSPFRYYQNPTWSEDGSQLAYVAVIGNGGKQTLSEMFVANVDDETSNKVYSSDTEHPFYLYWSPDNQNVSFLSSDAAGQSLLLQRVSVDGGKRVILDAGSPYYWSWAPDGNTMIVHTGNVNSTIPEHIAFLQVDSEIIEDSVDIGPASFQAPAWSPDGSRILLTRLNDDEKKEIALFSSTGEFEKAIGTFEATTSFAWSTDSQLMAYIEGDQAITAGTLGKLHVMDLTTSEDFFQDEDVFAFFWSPNSEKLAYFKPRLVEGNSSNQQLLLELHVLDVPSGESKQVLPFPFQPTNQFSAVLPYFDQYHQSATIWSPDSNNLVLSFQDADGNPGIAIVAASGQLEPRLLTDGYLAFWSWK